MFTSSPRQAVLNSLKICLMVGLLLLPFATSAAPTFALQTKAAPDSQTGNQDNNVVVLNEVQNSDGTTTVTVRIYASPSAPNAPNASYSMSQDTYIASGNPSGKYGSAYNLGIGYNSNSSLGALGALRMLLQFDLSSIPSYANVTNATIHIYQYAVSGISNMGFQAQYAVRSWDEYNTTWDSANNIGGAKLPIGNFPDTIGWLSANATNLFRTWVSGQQPNYGLILTGDESSSRNRSRYFNSANASSNRPYVDINYTVSCNTTPPRAETRRNRHKARKLFESA